MALCEFQPSGRERDGWIVPLMGQNEFTDASLRGSIAKRSLPLNNSSKSRCATTAMKGSGYKVLRADRATAEHSAGALEQSESQQSEAAKSWGIRAGRDARRTESDPPIESADWRLTSHIMRFRFALLFIFSTCWFTLVPLQAQPGRASSRLPCSAVARHSFSGSEARIWFPCGIRAAPNP